MTGRECSRCRRPPPAYDSDEFLEWETLEDDLLVCPECITGQEEQAIDEDTMRLADTTPLEDPTDPRDEAGAVSVLEAAGVAAFIALVVAAFWVVVGCGCAS